MLELCNLTNHSLHVQILGYTSHYNVLHASQPMFILYVYNNNAHFIYTYSNETSLQTIMAVISSQHVFLGKLLRVYNIILCICVTTIKPTLTSLITSLP